MKNFYSTMLDEADKLTDPYIKVREDSSHTVYKKKTQLESSITGMFGFYIFALIIFTLPIALLVLVWKKKFWRNFLLTLYSTILIISLLSATKFSYILGSKNLDIFTFLILDIFLIVAILHSIKNKFWKKILIVLNFSIVFLFVLEVISPFHNENFETIFIISIFFILLISIFVHYYYITKNKIFKTILALLIVSTALFSGLILGALYMTK